MGRAAQDPQGKSEHPGGEGAVELLERHWVAAADLQQQLVGIVVGSLRGPGRTRMWAVVGRAGHVMILAPFGRGSFGHCAPRATERPLNVSISCRLKSESFGHYDGRGPRMMGHGPLRSSSVQQCSRRGDPGSYRSPLADASTGVSRCNSGLGCKSDVRPSSDFGAMARLGLTADGGPADRL